VISISKISTLFHTVRYLKPIQVYSRILFYAKRFIPKNIDWNQSFEINSQSLKFIDSIKYQNTNLENSFEFLNLKKDFFEQIDWNYLEYGRLWTYNLNYFEFLNQEDMTSQDGEKLINKFVAELPKSIVGLEPYPLSLRCINWIKFLINHDISNSKIDSILFKQLNLLTQNLEYHLLGNHLLENGFALLFGAYYFNDKKLYKEAKKVLIPQLEEQILPDGGHFELSPMYHCTMLFRMLDCYNLVTNNDLFTKELEHIFKEKSELMLSWIKNVTFKNGNIPLMNDSAFKIAPTPKQLLYYALRLGLNCDSQVELKKSGYRKLINNKFELLVDVGGVGPDYQPGHAHADTFSFELYVNGRPVITDTGTSTYEINDTRFYERSTSAHNTVVVDNLNSSQVWGGHRVAKRAKVNLIKNLPDLIIANHSGYKGVNEIHTRTFQNIENSITIIDELVGQGVFYLHFAPLEKIDIIDNKIIGRDFNIEFIGGESIKSFITEYSPEFNKRLARQSISIEFAKKIETFIR
jgi:hypothetical protein